MNHAATRRPLLADPAFLTLWLVGAFTSGARWLELLVVGIYVFDVTGSPALVAALLMLRMLPLALFGAFAGGVAGRFDRKRILQAGLLLLTTLAGSLALLAAIGRLEVWHVAAAAFLAGSVWAMDFPARRTLIVEVAGADRTGAAMSLDTIASSGTKMVGPLVGGALYALVGMDGAFALTAVAYLAGFAVLATLRPPRGHADVVGGVFSGMADGLAGLRQRPVLIGVLATTVVFNVWGFPILSMVPVIGKDVLRLAPAQVGLLASLEGLGSLVAAISLARFARSVNFRHFYVAGVVIFLVLALGFAASSVAALSAVLLFGLGASLACFAAMQSSLMMLNAPPALRRQMMGALSVCIGTGPVGFAHLGVMAAWLGAPAACTVVALEGLVVFGLVLLKWPALFARQSESV